MKSFKRLQFSSGKIWLSKQVLVFRVHKYRLKPNAILATTKNNVKFVKQFVLLLICTESQSDTLQIVNLNGFAWDTCNSFYKEISTWKIK